MNKVRGQVEFHTAQKRAIYAEESLAGDQSQFRIRPETVADEPTPDDAAAVVEELQIVMQGLEPLQRQVMELALQDQSVEEISDSVKRSGRTVRRALQQIRESLEGRLLSDGNDKE